MLSRLRQVGVDGEGTNTRLDTRLNGSECLQTVTPSDNTFPSSAMC